MKRPGQNYTFFQPKLHLYLFLPILSLSFFLAGINPISAQSDEEGELALDLEGLYDSQEFSRDSAMEQHTIRVEEIWLKARMEFERDLSDRDRRQIADYRERIERAQGEEREALRKELLNTFADQLKKYLPEEEILKMENERRQILIDFWTPRWGRPVYLVEELQFCEEKERKETFEDIFARHQEHFILINPEEKGRLALARGLATSDDDLGCGLEVQPNLVAHGQPISIRYRVAAPVSLDMISTAGQTITLPISQLEGEGQKQMRLPAGLPPGVYFLQFRSQTELCSQRILVSN